MIVYITTALKQKDNKTNFIFCYICYGYWNLQKIYHYGAEQWLNVSMICNFTSLICYETLRKSIVDQQNLRDCSTSNYKSKH